MGISFRKNVRRICILSKHTIFTKRTLTLILSCLFILCLPVLGILSSSAGQNSVSSFLGGGHAFNPLTDRRGSAPAQDSDGYYMLCSPMDFKWFISTINSGNEEINIRLCNDLILNDTSNWENWADTPPENTYNPMNRFNGHFDGGGFALEGYYPQFSSSDAWQAYMFTFLGENARITDLHIRNAFGRTTYEASSYEDNDGRTDVVSASTLCF